MDRNDWMSLLMPLLLAAIPELIKAIPAIIEAFKGLEPEKQTKIIEAAAERFILPKTA